MSMYIQKLFSINSIIINKKTFTVPLKPDFFVLLTVKSFEILPKHSA